MKTILIVEDNKNQRLLYEQELTDDGYRVILASDGREAIAKVEEESPDLVVMDIKMPTMDGIEAMGRILEKNNRLPVILNTAYSRYKDDFVSWSADGYVVKSSDLAELKTKIQGALERRPQESIKEGQWHIKPSKEALVRMEKRLIFEALRETDANIPETAKNLGLSRAVLYSKMEAYGLGS